MCSHARKKLRKHYSIIWIYYNLFKPFPIIEEANSAPYPRLINQKIHSFPVDGKESATPVAFAAHENNKARRKWTYPLNISECSIMLNATERLTRKRTKIIFVEW